MRGDQGYRIGVLALQGAVSEHIVQLQRLGVSAIAIKQPAELENLDGLVLPGGESTVIGKLMRDYGFITAIRDFVGEGKGVFATCAGMILLAKEIVGGEKPYLSLLDISVYRNAFGRQVDSFQMDLDIKGLSSPFPAIFIRAPYVETLLSPQVEILAEIDKRPVLVKQGNLLACSFHPELSTDERVMQLFLQIVAERNQM
ncbi:glutamine amidotransferase [Gallibacterium anatis]|uniref:pyridoxal 5'-phosphate synthase glutaminase subunit PdxT n=1 Tax=Gallibacterium anatis TaxID=750 RepID=UPI0005321228|nr:pyridoxal 5'-phosphate synthase glutaminase subunit PdxT [Gallibacterium anatis]KGQ47755.1 glutamine amidotransferase [Gallibacterium anatis]